MAHGRTHEQTRAAIVSPLTMIASDGFIEQGRGHPRTSGSYSKVLGKYVRDERALLLPLVSREAQIGEPGQVFPRAAKSTDTISPERTWRETCSA